MPRSRLAFGVVCAVVFASCSDPSSDPTTPPEAPTVTTAASWTATVPEQGPFVDHADVAGADHLLVGAAIGHEGTTHAYVVAFGQGGSRAVHLSWPDGGTAVTQRDVDLSAVTGAVGTAEAIPTGLSVDDDGTWTMFGWGAPTTSADDPVVWRATGPGPDGPWIADPGVVLEVGEPGAWDSAWIDFPSVADDGGNQLMLYQGASTSNRNASHLGVAESADGAVWSPPAVPALAPDDCRDVRSLSVPRFVSQDGGYLVAYLAYPVGGDDAPIVVTATEAIDDLTCGEPVLSSTDLPGSGIHSFAMFESAEGPALLVEMLADDVPSSDLWVIPLER